jgi:hypothetical protein
VNIPLTTPIPGISGVTLSAGVRRNGLALIIKGKPVGLLGEVEGALLLHWAEVLVIVTITLVLAGTVHFRHEIASSHAISVWAVQNKPSAAGVVCVIAFVIGCLLAYWKKQQLLVYGTWEIVFGTFSSFQLGLVLFPAGDTSKFLALASALYVVSRGAGNVIDAMSKELAERITLKIGAQEISLGRQKAAIAPPSAVTNP